MTTEAQNRGGAPVGLLTDLDGIEATSVRYLRLWDEGADAQALVWNDLATRLGTAKGSKALQCFEGLCALCSRHGRRPLKRHPVRCRCLGADEACFAAFIATAATGAREDAMLMATLLVRPDVAPLMASLAADFGLALLRMQPARPSLRPNSAGNCTLH